MGTFSTSLVLEFLIKKPNNNNYILLCECIYWFCVRSLRYESYLQPQTAMQQAMISIFLNFDTESTTLDNYKREHGFLTR